MGKKKLRLEWRQQGSLHRENGKPAIVLFDNKREFWLNGVHYTDKSYQTKWRMKR